MDRTEKIIILITLLGLSLICGLAFLMIGCQTPGNVLSVDDVERILESEGDTICLDDGFDRICAKTIPGPAGKDGKDGADGKDGVTLIAVHEMRVEVIVEKIIEMIVVEEFVKEVPVEVVVERVIVEYVDREVPVEVFVERTVEIIKEVIIEVPGEKVFIEVPGETVFVEVPVEEIVESITQGATYTEEGYDNPPEGFHRHTFTHTHDGARHTHEIIHPDGEMDDFDREHDGFSGLSHN
ncbi:MAG: hypothetical protein OXU23_12575 [Candidatus Poribacteria bacterium]|nr:hypothetical protein [Candidatus Poribacteria bacterium]